MVAERDLLVVGGGRLGWLPLDRSPKFEALLDLNAGTGGNTNPISRSNPNIYLSSSPFLVEQHLFA